MKAFITDEGIELLISTAVKMTKSMSDIKEHIERLDKVIEDERDLSGVAKDDIDEMLVHVKKYISAAEYDVDILSNYLTEKANQYSEILGSHPMPMVSTGSINSISGQKDVGFTCSSDKSMVPNRNTPRELSKTQFGFTAGADGMLTYDSPSEVGEYLYIEQGTADANYLGTCGLCSVANIFRLAGVNLSEKDVLSYASMRSVGLCSMGSKNPEDNGATSPRTRKAILEHFGIKSSIVPVSFDGYEPSMGNANTIAKYVSEGKGVILSVDAVTLYDLNLPDPGYHAIVVTSVKKDKNGKPVGFYVCDSNGDKAKYYDADHLVSSLSGNDMNVTDSIIR